MRKPTLIILIFAGMAVAQTAAPAVPIEVRGWMDIGMVGLVLFLWRQDRADRSREKSAEDERYRVLAEDFREIVTENTRAISKLAALLEERVR